MKFSKEIKVGLFAVISIAVLYFGFNFLKGIEYFSFSEVFIFDRYGKLIKSSLNTTFDWDGTFNNQELPTSDYWYIINIDGTEFKGHVALKR